MSSFVITGSTKGIGYALAAYCAKQGHDVAISGRSQSDVEVAVERLQALGSGQVIGQITDISQREQLQALWDAASTAFSQVDVWINNAGVAHTTRAIVDIDPQDVINMVHTNVLGTIQACQVVVRGMQAQGSGRLFNVLGGGSDGEYFPGMGVYGTTKRGLDYLSRALVKELKDSPIIVGRVRPGVVVTEGMMREVQADPDNFEKSRRFLNILGDKPETVAPFLIENMLAMKKSGGKIAWLNGGKIGWRFLQARIKPREDLFAQAGL